MQLHRERWRGLGRRSTWGLGRGGAVALGLGAVLMVAFGVVALVADVPGEGRSWPGQGFVALAVVAFVGLVSLAGALRRR